MFLKLNGEYIVGHDSYKHDDYNVEVEDQILIFTKGSNFGLFCYKCINGKLVKLEEKEIKEQPQYIELLSQDSREKRNKLLKDSDIYVLNDYPISPLLRSSIKKYRKALRNLTEVKNFPKDIKWPELPKKIGFIKSLVRWVKELF